MEAVLTMAPGIQRAAGANSHRAERFAALYTAHYGRVLAYAQRRLPDRETAEDVTADVFRIAWEKSAEAKITPGWLFTTAQNVILHHKRAYARATALSRKVAEIQRRFEGDQGAQDERVLDALDRLADQPRELLIAHYWDGLTTAECAALAGCSAGAVRVRLLRARAQLKAQLEKDPA
jgi:RNA polymerase sigma-70 factor (ECF subfamily)